MKKLLLISSLVLLTAGTAVVFAADDTTYTGQFVNKYTQKITDTETNLKNKIEEKKQANDEAAAAKKQKVETKKQQLKQLLSE